MKKKTFPCFHILKKALLHDTDHATVSHQNPMGLSRLLALLFFLDSEKSNKAQVEVLCGDERESPQKDSIDLITYSFLSHYYPIPLLLQAQKMCRS